MDGFDSLERNANDNTRRFYGNEDFLFNVQPKFLRILQSVENDEREKSTFRYNEIVERFSSYILSRRNEIFDPRNLRVALVASDPLGEALGVSAFHRCQARSKYHILCNPRKSPIQVTS